MKSIKCKDLGGACDLEFLGSTFEEVEAQSKQLGREMFRIMTNFTLKQWRQ